MVIEIPDEYYNWVKDNLVSSFSSADIHVTDSARNLLAYGLKAQLEDKIVLDRNDLFNRAQQFSSIALRVYRRRYGSEAMNFNRAVHLLTDLNTHMGLFPWGSAV